MTDDREDEERLLRLPQVLALLPVGRSTFWAGIKLGRYPKPIKLGPRITVWRLSDIKAVIRSFGEK